MNTLSPENSPLGRMTVEPVYLCYEAFHLVKALNLHKTWVRVLPFVCGRPRSLKWVKLADNADYVNPSAGMLVIQPKGGATTNPTNSRTIHEVSGASAVKSCADMSTKEAKRVEMGCGESNPSDALPCSNDLLPAEDWEFIFWELSEYLRLNADYGGISSTR